MGRLIALFCAALLCADAGAAPRRIASLGLCTDELVLLLAEPDSIATVSFLGRDTAETPLAAKAAGIAGNDGSLESVLRFKPDLIVTGGQVNRRAHDLAVSVGIPIVDLPPPQTLKALKANISALGRVLGRGEAARRLNRWMEARLAQPPPAPLPALLVQTGGVAGGADGVTAELLRFGGLRLTPYPATRVSREQLLLDPPPAIVRSRYRNDAWSVAQSWTPPPGPWRELWLDGRLWTCPSPLAVTDVVRLRKQLAQ